MTVNVKAKTPNGDERIWDIWVIKEHQLWNRTHLFHRLGIQAESPMKLVADFGTLLS